MDDYAKDIMATPMDQLRRNPKVDQLAQFMPEDDAKRLFIRNELNRNGLPWKSELLGAAVGAFGPAAEVGGAPISKILGDKLVNRVLMGGLEQSANMAVLSGGQTALSGGAEQEAGIRGPVTTGEEVSSALSGAEAGAQFGVAGAFFHRGAQGGVSGTSVRSSRDSGQQAKELAAQREAAGGRETNPAQGPAQPGGIVGEAEKDALANKPVSTPSAPKKVTRGVTTEPTGTTTPRVTFLGALGVDTGLLASASFSASPTVTRGVTTEPTGTTTPPSGAQPGDVGAQEPQGAPPAGQAAAPPSPPPGPTPAQPAPAPAAPAAGITPETQESIEAQHAALIDPEHPREAMVYNPGEQPIDIVKNKSRYDTVPLPDGRTVQFDRQGTSKLTKRDITRSTRNIPGERTLGDILQYGHVGQEEAIQRASAGEQPAAVSTITAEGTPVKEAVGTAATVPEQVATQEASKGPGETVHVSDTATPILRREEGLRQEAAAPAPEVTPRVTEEAKPDPLAGATKLAENPRTGVELHQAPDGTYLFRNKEGRVLPIEEENARAFFPHAFKEAAPLVAEKAVAAADRLTPELEAAREAQRLAREAKERADAAAAAGKPPEAGARVLRAEDEGEKVRAAAQAEADRAAAARVATEEPPKPPPRSAETAEPKNWTPEEIEHIDRMNATADDALRRTAELTPEQKLDAIIPTAPARRARGSECGSTPSNCWRTPRATSS